MTTIDSQHSDQHSILQCKIGPPFSYFTSNLLERLWLGQDEVLAFLDDLTILIDNN